MGWFSHVHLIVRPSVLALAWGTNKFLHFKDLFSKLYFSHDKISSMRSGYLKNELKNMHSKSVLRYFIFYKTHTKL